MIEVNGVRLHHEIAGQAGPPLVLVHGSWGDHTVWSSVTEPLARCCRVVTYDRRGHSRSERPPGQGSIDEDADDLAGLIEALDLAPAHVAGNSFGASVSLRLASRRPELFASLAVHEPPLIGLLDRRADTQPIAAMILDRVASVAGQLASGDVGGASRRFVDEIALGPGSWEMLPPEVQALFFENASTWLDETRDPQALTVDLRALMQFSAPVLLTQGDQSPPFFFAILDDLAEALPGARRTTFEGAGHVPHQTHPEAFAAAIAAFVAQAATEPA